MWGVTRRRINRHAATKSVIAPSHFVVNEGVRAAIILEQRRTNDLAEINRLERRLAQASDEFGLARLELMVDSSGTVRADVLAGRIDGFLLAYLEQP
jgi:hypothetical protein